MFKKVFCNVLSTTWKNSRTKNIINNNRYLLILLNNKQTFNLSSKCIQTRYYNSAHKQTDVLNDNVEESKTDIVELTLEEVNAIEVNKDNKAAQKVLDEYEKHPLWVNKLRKLEFVIDLWRHEGRNVPDHIYPFQKLKLLYISDSAKLKFMHYLFLTEKTEEKRIKQKEIARMKLEEFRAEKIQSSEIDFSKIEYSLEKCSMFLRFYDTTVNAMYNNNVMKSMMFGNTIVLDCSYDEYMRVSDINSLTRQICFAISANRMHDRPFNIYLCNAKEKSLLMQSLKKAIPTLHEPTYPINITENSYLDIFDKKDLCYLTPHCKTTLTKYDPNTIYIIGAFVDKICREPISMAKAKRDGIQMAKLPLEQVLFWGTSSSKSLAINQCVNILLDCQAEKDMQKALKNVPTRKLKQTRDYVEQHNLRKARRRMSSSYLDDYNNVKGSNDMNFQESNDTNDSSEIKNDVEKVKNDLSAKDFHEDTYVPSENWENSVKEAVEERKREERKLQSQMNTYEKKRSMHMRRLQDSEFNTENTSKTDLSFNARRNRRKKSNDDPDV